MLSDGLPGALDDPSRRADYEHEHRSAAEKFFQPRMNACPWCASADIGFRIRVADTRQCKPGMFNVDECGRCGHVFQNPRLTESGLAYYCRDFYDGLGRAHYASVAEYSTGAHRKRARLLDAHPAPARWLDVGARHGHFCRVAGELLPDTTFWALDPSEEVLRGQDRGWIGRAARTPLVEFAEQHREMFDVVSMIHYLERTVSPQRELDAARMVLRQGGAALIELVNPESRFARLHGRYWYCWLAPQNLNLMPYRNFRELLEQCGFEVTLVQRGAANKPFDNLAALLTALNYHLPPARPWPWLGRRRVGFGERLLRKAAMVAAAPAFVLAVAVDLVLHLVTVRGYGGNTYRIVAVAR